MAVNMIFIWVSHFDRRKLQSDNWWQVVSFRVAFYDYLVVGVFVFLSLRSPITISSIRSSVALVFNGFLSGKVFAQNASDNKNQKDACNYAAQIYQ